MICIASSCSPKTCKRPRQARGTQGIGIVDVPLVLGGKWSEGDTDVALELAQDAKQPMPLAGLVDQLVKNINQERMKALLS